MDNIPKYAIIIYWSDEDDCYLAEVPDLPGCISDGKTIDEVTENIQVIIKQWIECAMLDGDEIPAPSAKMVYA